MKKVDQISAQYNVVQALAKNIQEVAQQMQDTLYEGMDDEVLDVLGKSSARLMEDLGDVLNGMDAVTEEDEWMEPVFERAHAMFPS